MYITILVILEIPKFRTDPLKYKKHEQYCDQPSIVQKSQLLLWRTSAECTITVCLAFEQIRFTAC